ncbi:hypothetical protein NX722_06525 [Endozoicomonas gorgoniicola]|uniref:Uncharacterized protein n=1 Tax=Endozoicomonas gorgoniicola TaxID=1234144 RepID=A0ABT3MSG7_9GAMM|nr:hypothetical protein [Endozoicomonas gorgoniicola]MCW7552308.1 hypothetical protein [Endozoicomonas gorgoniicola]
MGTQLPALFNESCYGYVIHINVPENRTVKRLAHTHIFIHNSDQNRQVFNLIQHIPFSRPGLIPPGWPEDQNH